ncbi:MAG: DMT family transporter [Geminicoccaceae bacterium]
MTVASAAGRSPVWTGNGLALVSTILWSSAFPATEFLLQGWDPLLLAVARLGGAAAAILLLAFLIGRGRELSLVPWRSVFLLGGFGVAASALLLVLGQTRTDAVTVGIISTTMPLIAALMAWAIDGRRPNTAVLAGIALAILGGIVATTEGAASGSGPRGGEILVLGSMVAWIWYSRTALTRLAGHGDLALSGLTFAAGATVLAVVSVALLALDVAQPRVALDGANLAAVLWMSVVAIGCSVPLWFASARILGITVTAIHTNLAPFYVMLMALAFGGTISGRQVVGAVLVAAGALLAQISARRQAAA